MSSRQIRQFCKLNDDCQESLRTSVNDLGLSARAHDKVLRVARTIADLAGDEVVREAHLDEAAWYRPADLRLSAAEAG
jgi:magnesium chelatase family protein